MFITFGKNWTNIQIARIDQQFFGIDKKQTFELFYKSRFVPNLMKIETIQEFIHTQYIHTF